MNKPDGKEMNAETLKTEITELIRRQTPERRAYLIIRNFFESQELSEEMCSEFKEWFASNDAEAQQ